MLQFLSRRWWGVTGWGYLLSLGLAVFMYWLLPMSSHIYRWTFAGAGFLDGFTDDSGMFVVVNDGNNNFGYYRLDINNGTMSKIANKTYPDRPLRSNEGFELSYSKSAAYDHPAKMELVNKAKGIRKEIPNTDLNIEVAYVYFGHGWGSSTTISLKRAGLVAMSNDSRWLILLSQPVNSWFSLKNWLRDKWKWDPTFLPNEFSRAAVIIDLHEYKTTRCELNTRYEPEYVIGLDGKGFAVVDQKRDLGGNAEIRDASETIISWYGLPPTPAHHSVDQWCFILGAFLVPVGVMMLRNLLLRKRSVSVSVPPHP
ncbi:MAG: hypothetical protein QM703_04680 [Gemmatales bacterium]